MPGWFGTVPSTRSVYCGRVTSRLNYRRGPVDLPSRVADNLFWLGRYAERAENIARLLRTSLGRVRRVSKAELDCLIRLHGCFESRHSKLPKNKPPTATELELEFISLMSDTKRPDSLASTLDEVHRVGGRVRERLSSDMMRLIGQLTASARVENYMLFVEYSGGAQRMSRVTLRVLGNGARKHHARPRLAIHEPGTPFGARHLFDAASCGR